MIYAVNMIESVSGLTAVSFTPHQGCQEASYL